MARDDPSCLERVANFTVGRRDYGSGASPLPPPPACLRPAAPPLRHADPPTPAAVGAAVRFLEPTDVRGLDLDTIVSFDRGALEVRPACTDSLARLLSCTHARTHAHPSPTSSPPPHAPLSHVAQVYLQSGVEKPEVGQGLNKPSEVAIMRVFKYDKATGRPTDDPEAVER